VLAIVEIKPNILKPYPTKPNILKQIRYEFNHKDRITRDILNGAEESKFMCERLCIHPSKEGEIQGFVQKISLLV
jgi:protein tyrosine/serine phosphatase